MQTKTEQTTRPIYEIANEIRVDWKNVNYAAKPYLYAMYALDKITDMYVADNAAYIISYFLANATTWKGEKAREIKKELNLMVKNYYNHN